MSEGQKEEEEGWSEEEKKEDNEKMELGEGWNEGGRRVGAIEGKK